MNVSENLKYTEKHEWVKIDNQFALIGISDYAQNSLGDLVYLQLPKVGSKINKGESCGTIESVKAAEDIYAPVSGEVIEINEEVIKDPSIINKDAYGSWLIKIKDISSEEISNLLDSNQYKELLSKLT
jgi:glycine cleavage system H protein